ncbi:hypothetical protein FQR65_LT00501 [Abscondita terminalis]|nr:hypothetical protein FQR65_LT00501 [Abscondita terminalis]
MFTLFLLIVQVFAYLELPKNEYEDIKKCVAQTIENIFGHEKTLLFLTSPGGSVTFPDVTQNPHAIINSAFASGSNFTSILSNEFNLVAHNHQSQRFPKVPMHVPINVTLVYITPIKDVNDVPRWFASLWSNGFENIALIVYGTNFIPKIFYSDPFAPASRCKQIVGDLSIGDCASKTKYQFNKGRLRKYHYCTLAVNVNDDDFRWFKKYARVTQLVHILKNAEIHLNISIRSSYTTQDAIFKIFQSKMNYFLSRTCVMTPYFRNDIVYVVPPPKLIPRMIVLKIVFKPNLWVAVCVVFLCSSVVWWLFDKYYLKKSTSSAIFDVFSITLSGSIDKVPLQSPLRLIFVAYVIYSIHIQTAFTSNLVTLLTIPQYESHIRTLEELADSNLPIATNYNLMDMIRGLENLNTLYLTIYNNFKVASGDEIVEIMLYRSSNHSCVLLESDNFNR